MTDSERRAHVADLMTRRPTSPEQAELLIEQLRNEVRRRPVTVEVDLEQDLPTVGCDQLWRLPRDRTTKVTIQADSAMYTFAGMYVDSCVAFEAPPLLTVREGGW